jgi:hypothetical protein
VRMLADGLVISAAIHDLARRRSRRSNTPHRYFDP